VIRRLYVHRFRCLENFTLSLAELPSVLLIGNNGTGKSTVGFALEVLQRIGRGSIRARDVISRRDFTVPPSEAPTRFEIEVELPACRCEYSVAFDAPEGQTDPRVFQEKFSVNGQPVFEREITRVHLFGRDGAPDATIAIEWNLVALPLISPPDGSPLEQFRGWLSKIMILRPVPSQITGESAEPTLLPEPMCLNFGAWFTGLLQSAPAAYSDIVEFLKKVMPDFSMLQNPPLGEGARSLIVSFNSGKGGLTLKYRDLSDGEKCYLIASVALASQKSNGPLVCFWDEPDAHLSMSEVGHFVMALRREFQGGSQFIMTSHNPEAIRRFSSENTLVFYRRSHLEPSNVRPVSEIQVDGDLVDALIRGDVEP
jgi:energy-coupling factor transporter ATP-binding protein EcfA2